MKRAILFGAVSLLLSCSTVWADLLDQFDGFTYVNEIGDSGLKSDNGATKLPTSIPELGPGQVSYPSGVGTVPSPGGAVGKIFDQGVLGVMTDGGNLIVKLAGGLNPATGYYYSGWQSTYGQGDVFITVQDDTGVKNFALLSQWGANVHLGKSTETYYNTAQSFHADYQGFLVELTADQHVVLTSGAGAYTPGASNSPAGLDYRIFAQDGTVVGDAGLVTGAVNDGQMWYLQTWTVPLSWLSSDPVFQIGLHAATSCSNDQIALTTTVVPVPAAAILGMLGLGVAGWRLRRIA